MNEAVLRVHEAADVALPPSPPPHHGPCETPAWWLLIVFLLYRWFWNRWRIAAGWLRMARINTELCAKNGQLTHFGLRATWCGAG